MWWSKQVQASCPHPQNAQGNIAPINQDKQMQWPSPTLFTNNNINLPADMSATVCEKFHKIFKEVFHSSEMQKVTGTKKKNKPTTTTNLEQADQILHST